MTVRVDRKSSLTSLLCTVLLVTWVCHIGRSQLDQEGISIAVCKDPIVNSSVPIPNGDIFNCSLQELASIAFGLCNGNVTLEADPVAVNQSKSSVVARVNSSDSNATLLYNLCIFPPKFWDIELIACLHNNTEVAIDVDWKYPGPTNISVFVYEEEEGFIGCARTSIHVAVNHGLQLNVSLQNDPAFPSITPLPFPSDDDPPFPGDIDVLTSIDDDDDGNRKHYLIGNITFLCETNHSEGDMYFKYSFSDGDSEPYTSADSMTHIYESAGTYNYTVDAVAVNEKGSRAFHAVHSGQINVLEPVSGITMKVSGDKLEVNVEATVTISAFGSRPIIACWYITTPESISYHPVNSDPTHEPTIPPSPIYTCRLMNDSSVQESMTFFQVGQYVFVAAFYNDASRANSTIPFGVVQNPSKVVVASTSTLIAILAILIIVVIVLLIIMGLYIPYRKYKTKFTETANFKFVDLSESTQWDRAKMKVREFANKFSKDRRSSSKVGLVNEQNESARLMMNFPYAYESRSSM